MSTADEPTPDVVIVPADEFEHWLFDESPRERALRESLARHPAGRAATRPCACACSSGDFCGGCGHAGCGRR